MNNIRGAKIIYQESKATQPSHLYFLQKGENYCEVIVTSESGAKRKVGTFNMSYIPLSGTLQQSPVIGDIEFSTDYDTKLFSGDAEIKLHDGYLELNSTNNHGIAVNPNQAFIKSGLSDNLKYINFTKELDYIPVKSTVNGAGLVGVDYYGNNYENNSFVQKKYVDDALRNIDLSNFYTKNETYSQTEINGLLDNKQNKLESVTGNTGVGKTDASATEKLDVNGNVKATGFKVDNGTETQALTANGGIFDLTTKVDKPTTDGTWMLQKIGAAFNWVAGVVQNIANTDLTNLSARIFTQGNTFTWDTGGFDYKIKNLLDKTVVSGFDYFLASNSDGSVGYVKFGINTTINGTSGNIDTNTLDVTGKFGQHGNNSKYTNTGAIDFKLICQANSHPDFFATYTQMSGRPLTFEAGAGVTLIALDGVFTLNSTIGSVAKLTRHLNTYYLEIINR